MTDTHKNNEGYNYLRNGGFVINPEGKDRRKVQTLTDPASKAKKKVLDLIDEQNMKEDEDPLYVHPPLSPIIILPED